MGEAVVQRGVVAGDGSRVARPPIEHVPSRRPQIGDYATQRRTFTWEEARTWLDGLPDGGLNIAHEAVDRHAHGPLADAVALRFLSRTDPPSEAAYAALARQSDAAAVALRLLGVERGDRVCTLLPRSPALYLAALGTLKAGAVYCPSSPPSGWTRCGRDCGLGRVKVLVTDPESYSRKIEPVRADLPDLESVLLVGAGTPPPGTQAWDEVMADAGTEVPTARASPSPPPRPTTRRSCTHQQHDRTAQGRGPRPRGRRGAPRDRSLLPRPRPGDIYWCTADPGWVTGTSYGIFGPLSCGATVVTDSADFDARRWYSILQEERIEVFYTAPTACGC